MITDQQMHEAIDRIARSADGELLYRWLQLELQRLALSSDAGALLVHHGRRSLAYDLMGHMAAGIEQSDGRNSSASERPVVIARREPIVSGRRHPGGRRVLADPNVGEYLNAADAGDFPADTAKPS